MMIINYIILNKIDLVPSGLWRFSVAAVFIILFISGAYVGLYEQASQSENYQEVVAQYNELYLLPDSSKVWMQPGSSIRFAKEFNADRRVWLTGNSLFEVRKQAGSTFRVYIEKAFIEVKGTCFLIKQNKTEESKITLFNGSIEFNIEGTDRQIAMRPMQEMIYNPVGATTELRQVHNVDWQNGKYNFTNIGLKRLVEIMNQMYDTEIRLEAGINKESAFTGSIRYDEPLEDVIDKICFSLNLRKKDLSGKTIIYN